MDADQLNALSGGVLRDAMKIRRTEQQQTSAWLHAQRLFNAAHTVHRTACQAETQPDRSMSAVFSFEKQRFMKFTVVDGDVKNPGRTCKPHRKPLAQRADNSSTLPSPLAERQCTLENIKRFSAEVFPKE